jgi:hypothetical protein
VHAEKLKSSQVSSLIWHDSRATENHTNEQIDPARSHLNYNLHPGDPMELYRKRLSELTFKKKKSTNVMCSWIVSCPKQLIGTDDEKRFFETMYGFLGERYGWKNVVSSFVHLDETTPHLHFKFVPAIVEDGIEKLNAKKVIYRTELSRCQRDAEVHCQKVFGMEKLILNGATAGGNKTVKELKLMELEKKLVLKNEELESVHNELEDKKQELNQLKVELSAEKTVPLPKKIPFMGEVVPFSEHKALINEFNELVKTSNELDRSVIYWKKEKNDVESHFKTLQSDYKSLENTDWVQVAITLKNDLRTSQREIEQLNETNSRLNDENERLSVFESFYWDFVSNVAVHFENIKDFLGSLVPSWATKIFNQHVRDELAPDNDEIER